MGLVLFHEILEFWVWGVRKEGREEKEFCFWFHTVTYPGHHRKGVSNRPGKQRKN